MFRLVWVLSILVISCQSSPEKTKKELGQVQYATTIYSNGVIAFQDTITIWYRDSLTIQELHTNVTNSVNGVITTSFRHEGYKFIDLGKEVFADYSTLDSNAKPKRGGQLSDTAFNNGGWAFYQSRLDLSTRGVVTLPDTLIDRITYQRKKWALDPKYGEDQYCVCLAQCDENSMFSLQKDLPCTATKIFIYSNKPTQLTGRLEIYFSKIIKSDSLATVFDAWSK